MQCGRPGFDPWVVEIPWKRERLPTAVFWPGEFHGLYIHGVAESDATEWLSLFITSVLSFLIAELLFRNFRFLQSGVVISLSLLSILLILSADSVSCDYLGFLLCFSFLLATIMVQDIALLLGLLQQSFHPVLQVCLLLLPSAFSPLFYPSQYWLWILPC